jgi:hypothetical protein
MFQLPRADGFQRLRLRQLDSGFDAVGKVAPIMQLYGRDHNCVTGSPTCLEGTSEARSGRSSDAIDFRTAVRRFFAKAKACRIVSTLPLIAQVLDVNFFFPNIS